MNRWLTLGLMACNGGETPDEGSWEDNFGVIADEGDPTCDNLDTTSCVYPFPSSVYLREGGLFLPENAMAPNFEGPVSTGAFERFEAYGAATPLLFQLPGAVPDTSHVFDTEHSVSDASDTLLLNASTGERIPHWLETDYLSEAFPTLFVIRPAIPLPRGTEIVVAVRGQTDDEGAHTDAPDGFASLRDRTATPLVGVHERRDHYEEVIFPALELAGWTRDEVQLAWSFPVRTDESATARMLAVRDTIFAALPATGPEYQIDEILDCPSDGTGPSGCHPSIRTIVDGTIFVPSVVEQPDELGVRLLRLGADGQPMVEQTEAWPFRLQIPHIAYDGPGPVPVLQYGHGFLGSMGEANNSWLRNMAERKGFVILATDMQGMNENDTSVWLDLLLQDGGRFPDLVDLAMQGVVNQLAQQRMVGTSLAQDPSPSLYRADAQLAWDPTTIWYHGNSQGGSVGTLVMALSEDVTRGDLGVPGSGYPFLLHRSSVFEPFALLITAAYPDPDSIARFLGILGTGWDDFDPLTFAPHIHGDPLPGTPDHEVILHVAKEDQQVHNEASFILGRATGATLMIPAVRPVFGLPEQAYPASPGVALVEVDFAVPDDPTPLTPADGDPELANEGDTHGWLRRWEPAQDQMIHFFETGEMIDVCGGVSCFTDGPPP